MSTARDSANFPSKLGKWTIHKRLASRIDKIVLLGEHAGQFAAIKILKNADLLDDRERMRFDQEVLNLKKLHHPAIPKIVDLDLTDAMQPWIATEYVNGETIQERVNDNKPLNIEEWLKALRDISNALSYIHAEGIYHRDVSPSNIILGTDSAKLIDFGLSFLENSQSLTKSGMNVQGTPGTVSPESLSFKKDPKMDMFSLGSTFVFAATGKFPFENEFDSVGNWMHSVLYDEPNFSDLDELQKKLLTPLLYKKTNERISASELLQVLDEIASQPSAVNIESQKLEHFLYNASEKLSSGYDSHAKKRKLSIPVQVLLGILGLSSIIFVGLLENNSKTIQTVTPVSGSSTSANSITNTDATSPSPISETKMNSECYKAIETNRGDVSVLCLENAKAGDLEAIWHLGRYYQSQSLFKEAAGWFLKGAKGGDYQSMLNLVESYEKLGKIKESQLWLEECAKGYYGINANSPKSAIGRCKLLYAMDLQDQGKETQAILYLRDAITYGQGQAATFLSLIYRDQGKVDLMVKALEEGVNLGDDNAVEYLIEYYDKSGNSNAAQSLLQKVAEKGNQKANRTLAARLIAAGEIKSAKEYATKCASAGLPECNYFMGLILFSEKNIVEAKKYFTKASNQGLDVARVRLASLLWLQEGKISEAEGILKPLIAKNNFDATVMIVGIYLQQSNLNAACENATKASSLGKRLKSQSDWSSDNEELYVANEKTITDFCLPKR